MTELSPQAQAVWDAAYNTPEDCPYEHDLAAALRAAADQVVPKEWPTIEDYNEYDQGVAAAHIKHRNQILAIADELEGIKYGTYRCQLEEFDSSDRAA